MKKTIKISTSIIIAIIFLFIIISSATTNFNDNFCYAQEEKIYLGGIPIGIIAKSDGLIVEEIINISTNLGNFSPAFKSGIKKGDIIIAINGIKTNDVEKISNLIDTLETLNLTILRKDEIFTTTVNPEYDLIQNKKRLGLILKNDIAGVGTLTYIKSNGNYGALGHQIIDGYGYGDIYNSGSIYRCNINGYNRANKNSAGELIGSIDLSHGAIGTVTSNKFCGIYGNSSEKLSLKEIKIGHRDTVKCGKAYIYTTINGNYPKAYEIQIIKTENQSTPSEKSMIIRITDKSLLDATGGILQGMSGSPIIQNNNLIGAVTHVLTNDSKTGYGIYIDWML